MMVTRSRTVSGQLRLPLHRAVWEDAEIMGPKTFQLFFEEKAYPRGCKKLGGYREHMPGRRLRSARAVALSAHEQHPRSIIGT
jgi:hypothetical protein